LDRSRWRKTKVRAERWVLYSGPAATTLDHKTVCTKKITALKSFRPEDSQVKANQGIWVAQIMEFEVWGLKEGGYVPAGVKVFTGDQRYGYELSSSKGQGVD